MMEKVRVACVSDLLILRKRISDEKGCNPLLNRRRLSEVGDK